MEDDIYSLGVCLFEIGLWRSMFTWDAEQEEYVIGDWLPRLFDWDLDVQLENVPGDSELRSQLKEIAEHNLRNDIFKRFVSQMLPPKMGNAYTEAVLNCLNFQNGRRERSTIDKDKSAKRYVEDVLLKLQRILVS